jgi:hypothetical protein
LIEYDITFKPQTQLFFSAKVVKGYFGKISRDILEKIFFRAPTLKGSYLIMRSFKLNS